MRIIYCRRTFLSVFVVSILSMFFLGFITIYYDKQENIVSLIYNTENNCSDAQKISPNKLSTLPPNYLVVPYREFALRTSMACRTFKLDNPKEDRANFHPKYSRYLRGSFPYVLPHKKITFNDIEKYYAKISVKNEDEDSITQTSFANNITFEHIPYKFHDGMWHPNGIKSAQRTAILVPLQGREYNAKTFLLNMHAFLRRQQLTYTILLIEQISPLGNRFNKGRLFNTAIHYLEKESLNITCIVLHDVDLIPEDDGNFYTCESKYPKHTTTRVRKLDSTRGYTRYYEFLIGGVLILTFDMYKTLNGFSNLYWGWGGEDDDLALRFIQQRMCVVRPSYELAIYIGLPHPRGQRNSARFGLLTWSTIRFTTDGYAQVEPLTRIVDIHKTSIVTHLKIDANADETRNKPPSIEKSSPSVNASNVPLTSTSKATKKTKV